MDGAVWVDLSVCMVNCGGEGVCGGEEGSGEGFWPLSWLQAEASDSITHSPNLEARSSRSRFRVPCRLYFLVHVQHLHTVFTQGRENTSSGPCCKGANSIMRPNPVSSSKPVPSLRYQLLISSPTS